MSDTCRLLVLFRKVLKKLSPLENKKYNVTFCLEKNVIHVLYTCYTCIYCIVLLSDCVVSTVGAEASSFHDNSNHDDVDGAMANTPDATPAEQKTFHLCLIHGGMDTVGEVFDDVLIINLEGT